MTAEDERTNNGGENPAEVKEEYRQEDRYSVRLSSGDPTPDEAPGDGENDVDADRPEGHPGERLTREELESRYRNDPRFNMLFDHENKDGKKNSAHYIKIGGIRLTPKRILILCGFLFVVLLCLCCSLFYAFRDIGKYRNYRIARAVFEAGDYETAKELFVKVISDDPNKEDAIKAMAQIYHHYKDWGNESFFRQRLMRLNPLNEEYFQDFLKATFRARVFGTIYSHLNLKVMENPELPPEEGALYLISALHSDHVSEGKQFYSDRIKENPRYFSETEYGRYAELLLNASELNREKVWNIIASLPDIEDEQIRFETINTILYFLSKQNDRESEAQMEKLLRESAELNEYAGAPMLANYYFSNYRFDETIKLCETFLKTKMNAVIPILYGESCALSGQTDLIPPLADKVRGLRGRQSRIIASHLDALAAFCDGDDARLRSAILDTGSTIETPLALLMNLQMTISLDSPKEILHALEGIMKEKPFMDFTQRARTAVLSYLIKKTDADIISSPDELNIYAEIAALLETPGDDVSYLRRIVLLDHFKRNVLKEEDLLNALEKFPGDSVLLRIAAEYYLMRHQPARAMDYITQYNSSASAKPSTTMTVMHILALDLLGRKTEAEKEFRTIVEKSRDDGFLLCLYYEFCVENEYVDSLKSLSAWIESLPAGSPNRAVLPFIQAELLLAEGKKEQALDLFEKASSDDPRFVFHAAVRLDEFDRNDAALKRYLSVLNDYPDKVLVNIRLSELYSKMGDSKKALEYARSAWQFDSDNLHARYVYGKQLLEAGQYPDVISVLSFPQYKASFPNEMIELWSKAIREQIKRDYDAARYTPAIENAKFLLIYFPDDPAAKDYINKVELIRRQERRGE